MNKICTSLEQSKKLLELGIDVNTADMYWWSTSKRSYIEAMDDGDFNEAEGHIPAWSLSALMNLLDDKAGLAKDYGLWFCYDNGKSHCTKHYNEMIDAAFEMVCWLKENRKI